MGYLVAIRNGNNNHHHHHNHKHHHVCQCLVIAYRSFTDLRRGHPIFSLATSLASNDFLIFKLDASDLFDLWVRDKNAEFALQDYKLNTWNAICSTWDATSGIIQLWVNGKPSSRKFVSSGFNISEPMSIVLGQVQFKLTVTGVQLLY